jgi:hypothetical protein
LPDLAGATDPSHLLALLKTATKWKSRRLKEYNKYFGLSAAEWRGSTRQSLFNMFGDDSKLLQSPRNGPNHPIVALGARTHFINCHGAPAASEFYGQSGNKFPTSLSTGAIGQSIREGTIAAVECCYGGELYDSITLSMDIPICQSYLAQGSYGYFASTTIAYGPADQNGAADLICQYFILNVLDGASIGRAALMARQQFVANSSQMDPIDLKTLAQFCLYGDPSVHPVEDQSATIVPQETRSELAKRFRRRERRAKLEQTGGFLQQTKPTASKKIAGGKRSAMAIDALANIARKGGLPRNQQYVAFKVKGAKKAPKGSVKLASAPSRYYLAVGTPEGGQHGKDRVAVVAKEVGGRIIDYRVYHGR